MAAGGNSHKLAHRLPVGKGQALENKAPLCKHVAISFSRFYASACQYETMEVQSFLAQMLGEELHDYANHGEGSCCGRQKPNAGRLANRLGYHRRHDIVLIRSEHQLWLAAFLC